MNDSPRLWWRNCALSLDDEIRRIDRMEDELQPITQETRRVRELISGFELCHHKAGRWIDHLLEAIAAGDTHKGLGTREPGAQHDAEKFWKAMVEALQEWCRSGGRPPPGRNIGPFPASHFLGGLGTRTPLKAWQVERVIERVASLIDWPRAYNDPATAYQWILLSDDVEASTQGPTYRERCPDRYLDHEDFWWATIRAFIQDTVNGQHTRLSLGLAIDMLWPCHWNFPNNLRLVLNAIGGQLRPGQPFAACGRNIGTVPLQSRVRALITDLRDFADGESKPGGPEPRLVARLGHPTGVKRWLAASLEKTLRLQLDPPDNLRAASSLAGPAWLFQEDWGPEARTGDR